MKLTSINRVKSQFSDVRQWFDDNMLVDKIDLADQSVYEYVYHAGRWCGIFQGTSRGAQRFFEKAKPRSITDIAVLTSIYRPGPLAAGLEKLWLEVLEGKEYDWGDRRINDILAKTRGLLIFQEGVMELAEKVAGFPKEKCDEVRRAIMKRSISGGDAAKAKVDEMKSSFVDGAMNNGYTRDIAENVYEKICFFSGYGFNSSHAYSYAIDSYYCAWLLTYHEDKWLSAYLEAMQGNPDNKAEAASAVRALGYTFVPIDINYANASWTILPGKKFMPSFLSCKGIGASAIEEIIANRPYKSIVDMLWDIEIGEDGQITKADWRHSKFNKRALETLVKTKSLDSLDEVGDGKTFASYKHMHHVIIENADKIKKTSKRDPTLGIKNFFEIVKNTCKEFSEEWTRRELIDFQIEAMGSLDVNAIVTPDLLVNLKEKNVKSIDQLEVGQKEVVWFVNQAIHKKVTKNKKTYGMMEALGPSGKVIKLNVWGWKGDEIETYSTFIAEVEKNDFGCSTTQWKLKKIKINHKQVTSDDDTDECSDDQ